MMRLLIDAGNTNIKIALVDADRWLSVVSLPQGCELDFSAYPEVQQVYVSNVAGSRVQGLIVAACAARNWQPVFVASLTAQCGVRNGYAVAGQLGCDRWCALIAAWHLEGRSCLVVGSGTATTVDALSADGEFIGGLILPGIALMLSSLAGATANLPGEAGNYAEFPCCTKDAMYSGAIQAVCGAIERQQGLLGCDAPVLLSGGAAGLLSPHLSLQVKRVDNLVLQGLLIISRGDA